MKPYMSLREVAALIAVPSYRITYCINQNKVQDTQVRIANHRAFSQQDVRRLAAYFGVSIVEEPTNETNEDE